MALSAGQWNVRSSQGEGCVRRVIESRSRPLCRRMAGCAVLREGCGHVVRIGRLLEIEEDHFAVIGGGFIGSEVAAALAMNGKKVTMIFPENSIGSRVFPIGLSQYVTGYYRQKGVDVVAGSAVTYLEAKGDRQVLRLSDGKEISVDGVVAGIGIEPNVELSRAIGLKIDDGIVVDEFLRTGHPDIYAAGDVAAFTNPALRIRMRVEHEDNANTMGKIAGSNMAGRSEPYCHLPSFYSDLFELGYEAVGMVDTRLDIIADWIRPNEEGSIFYMQDRRVRGVLLWRIGGKVDAARRLIVEEKQFQPEDLKGRLPAAKTLVEKPEVAAKIVEAILAKRAAPPPPAA